MDCKRKEDRAQTKGGIIYVLSSKDSSDSIHSGLISNISDSGACIYTQEELNKSTHIRIYLSNISQAPINARVQWCRQASDDLFKAGLLLDN